MTTIPGSLRSRADISRPSPVIADAQPNERPEREQEQLTATTHTAV